LGPPRSKGDPRGKIPILEFWPPRKVKKRETLKGKRPKRGPFNATLKVKIEPERFPKGPKLPKKF